MARLPGCHTVTVALNVMNEGRDDFLLPNVWYIEVNVALTDH